jgi:hypothetical protein
VVAVAERPYLPLGPPVPGRVGCVDPEEDWDEDCFEDDGDDEPARNRFAEALTVFGIAFPFAVLLVLGVTAVFVAIVYGVVVLLVRAFTRDYGG